ncbi:GAF domain-containing sensor histidine kinase [Aquincola sp. S2]|uniref:histidine kinase n=1 Tax=Pseudaquabacterium terrae TaxID=2732868 RepID=A0ABX2ER52_9BURK|nr:GAF domain-containing sensor histidine kinase [Aquabacterium terrae]NRF71083.1 GAF domain-containing sensor histidine kinase [Aquabacterium terrae]
MIPDLHPPGTPVDPVLDGLLRCAAALAGCPIAVVSAVDRPGFEARVGADFDKAAFDAAFGVHALPGDEPFEVPDASVDPRHAGHPLVSAEPRLRFCAGVPIGSGGQRIGALCVIDHRPRQLDAQQRALLRDLARAVEQRIASRDLEQLRRDKLVCERASRAKTAFVAQVSHELRTPLNAVLGFTQLMQADGQLPERARGQLQHIAAACDHLLALVDDILDLARIEYGGRAIEPQPLDVRGVLQSNLALVEPLALERGIRVMPVRGPDAAVALADRRALGQVLLNLLSNAIKYNRERGRLWVELRSVGAEVAIGIGDEGQGLSAEQRARLFRPFERLAAKDGRVPGTGLGLVISKQLVQAMSGRLEVHRRPDGGCQFEVWLPSQPFVGAARAPLAGRRSPPGDRRRQTCADDDEPDPATRSCATASLD